RLLLVRGERRATQDLRRSSRRLSRRAGDWIQRLLFLEKQRTLWRQLGTTCSPSAVPTCVNGCRTMTPPAALIATTTSRVLFATILIFENSKFEFFYPNP